MAAKIKRELQVKFSTTGDGQVVRSIASVDSALKSTEQAGEGAGKSIADLSESLDKGLENSVGRAFKATDRLNSIVGQVTGAIGLATLAVGAIATAYELATKALNQNTKAQEFANKVRNQATREIDAYLAAYAALPGATAAQVAEHVREAAAMDAANRQMAEATAMLEAAKQAREGAAAALRSHNEDIKRGFANNLELARALDARKQASDRVAQADAMAQRAAEAYAAAGQVLGQTLEGVRVRQIQAAQASIALGQAWSRFGSNAAKVGRGLLNVAVPGLNQVVNLVGNKKALADAEEFGRSLGKMLDLDYGGGKPPTARAIDQTVESLAQLERRIKGTLKDFDEQIDRALGLSSSDDKFAQFVDGLRGLVPVAENVGLKIKKALNLGGDGAPSPVEKAGEDLTKFSDIFKKSLAGLDKDAQKAALASIDAMASGAETLGRGFASAAAAALVYGESFSEVASQAVAGLAAQATTEALFQSAKALAYLAAGLFTGSPAAFTAAAQAGASAAAFGAIAAITVPVARATGSASGAGGGGGVPSGPSARDAGIGGPSAGDGGGDTIILNVGTPISTEADIGAAVATALNASGRSRGRTRVNRRAIGRA